MSELPSGIHKKSAASELEVIKQKRNALNKLIKLNAMMHQLHQGLKSVLLIGAPVVEIPKGVISHFKSLTQNLKDKPTPILKNTLLATDQKIERDIKHVLEISQKSNQVLEQYFNTGNKDLAEVLKQDYQEFVDNFKKKSHTSISLRITLEARKVLVKLFRLPVPESFIKKQITLLEQQEEQCKQKIKEDLFQLQEEVHNLIQQEDCPDKIKELLQDIDSELTSNGEHLKAGKPVDEMPVVYDNIELSGHPDNIEEIEKMQAENTRKDVQHENQQADKQSAVQKERSLSFWQHLWRWLNTPWKKGWRDIDH